MKVSCYTRLVFTGPATENNNKPSSTVEQQHFTLSQAESSMVSESHSQIWRKGEVSMSSRDPGMVKTIFLLLPLPTVKVLGGCDFLPCIMIYCSRT